jgi:hypothetical protein
VPANDGQSTSDTAGTRAAIAGGVGAMAACCTVQLLIVAGVLAGLGGAAIGGIALAVGLATAATVWGTAVLLRRRRTRSAARCPTPAQQRQAGRHVPASPKDNPR